MTDKVKYGKPILSFIRPEIESRIKANPDTNLLWNSLIGKLVVSWLNDSPELFENKVHKNPGIDKELAYSILTRLKKDST